MTPFWACLFFSRFYPLCSQIGWPVTLHCWSQVNKFLSIKRSLVSEGTYNKDQRTDSVKLQEELFFMVLHG